MNSNEKMKTLSSATTSYMQIIFGAWTAIFGLIVVYLWIYSDVLRDGRGAPVSGALKWVMLGVWIPYATYVYWFILRLKRVCLSGRTLLVSYYFKEIQIPIEDIAEVTSNKWMNHHPTIIHLRHSTEFGDKISFLPKVQLFGIGKRNPIVDELCTLSGTAVPN